MRKIIRQTLLAFAMSFAALAPGVSSAQDVLPWKLSDHPSGGQELTVAVTNPLVSEPDLLIPTCEALAPGNAEQMTDGFVGIAKAVDLARTDIALEILDQMHRCCRCLHTISTDERIRFGTVLAHATREIGEQNIYSAQTIDRLIGFCEEDLQRAYDIARGDDALGIQISKSGPYGPDVTGSILPPAIGGGGLPSNN